MHPNFFHTSCQKYSRLRCLLRVKGLLICYYLGLCGRILQFGQNIIKVGSKSWLKYGFCKKYFDRNEPLTSWTLLSPVFFQIRADLEKNGGQKCSIGQRFIFTEVTFCKIHILVTCSSNITLSLSSYTGSALKRELNFYNGYFSLL